MKRWWKASALALLLLTAPTSAQAKMYKDVQPTDWYYKQVHTLSDKGILDGFQDGTFRPSDKVTRAQVTKILNATIRSEQLNHTKQREAIPFIDVRSDRWFAPHVATMYEYGIASGLPDRSFRPDRLIKRSEMARMLAETFHMDRAAGTAKTFSDVHPSKWYAPYVAQLSKANVTQGSTRGEFLPDAPVTRGELSIFLARAIEWNDSLRQPNDPPTKPTPPVETPTEPTEKPTEQPSVKPIEPTEKPTEKPIEKPTEPTEKPSVKPSEPTEKPTKPQEPQEKVFKEVNISVYDTYSKESLVRIQNRMTIELYHSEDDYNKGKDPYHKQLLTNEHTNNKTELTLNKIKEGSYFLVADLSKATTSFDSNVFYKDVKMPITVQKDGTVKERFEFERVHQIPMFYDKDFSSAEKVKDSKEYFKKEVNQYRAEHGLGPIDFDTYPELEKMADERAKHLEERFSHFLPSKTNVDDYYASFNPLFDNSISEAISMNYANIKEALKGWKKSVGHNYILLREETNIHGDEFELFGAIGVHKKSNGTLYFAYTVFSKDIK